MSELAALQQLFWRAVRTDPAPPEVDQAFVSRGKLTGRARLGIYRTAYWVRQVSALRELFPLVVAALGDGPFAREASRYLGAHPSCSYAVEALGRGFPAWLAQHASLELGELAAVEWARFVVFVAPDVASVRAGEVEPGALPEATVRVGPQVEVVHAGARTLSAELPAVEGATHVAVWREDFSVHQLRLLPAEARAVEAAKAGLPFPALCALLAGGDESLEMPARVFGVFHAWLARGWVVSLFNTPG